MKKLFTFAAAILASVAMMAEIETEVIDQAGAGSDAAIVKTATTLPGNYDAGQGGGAIKDYPTTNKGVKLRTQKTKVTVNETEYGYAMITINSGYAVRGITIEGTSNGSNSITMYGVYADVDIENLETSIASGTNQLAADVVFPNKNTTYVGSPAMTFDAVSNVLFLFAGSGDNQMRAIITVSYERTASCVDPTIEWNVEPANGAVGAADFTASVNVPAGQTVAWESSVPEVATVENGVIHYVAPGVTTIKASYTYVGDDYCNIEASISKEIVVPITYDAAGENDKIWYFQDAVPSENPVDGLTYPENGTGSGNGQFGIKLNSSGYAWFVKPAVAGTLRVGAFIRSGSATEYEVNVFACNASGEKLTDEALGSLSTPHAGGVSATMNIAEEVAGLRIERKTGSEGILYFIEFREGSETTAIKNVEQAAKASKFVRNGQLFILKNGVVYNAQGAIVK